MLRDRVSSGACIGGRKAGQVPMSRNPRRGFSCRPLRFVDAVQTAARRVGTSPGFGPFDSVRTLDSGPPVTTTGRVPVVFYVERKDVVDV